MMRNHPVLAIFLVVLGLATVATWSGGKESGLPLKDLPEEVKRAASQAVPGIQLVEAEVERVGRGVVYELEGILGGRRYEIEVTEDGKVIEVELEDDEEIPLAKVPRPAMKAARAALPGAKLVEAEIVRNERGLVYEIEATRDGKEYEILVTPDGQVVKVQEEAEDPDDEQDDEVDL